MSAPSGTDQPDFSLVRGGPWYRFQTWLRLVTPESLHVGRRAVLYPLLAWLPLVILTMIQGSAADRVSFLHDIATHVRLLIQLPALILAEGMIDLGTRLTATHLRTSGVVPPERAAFFDHAVRGAARFRDSWIVATAIVALSLAAGWSRTEGLALDSADWLGRGVVPDLVLTAPGWWFCLVASPLATSYLLRSVWRFTLWVGFLVRLSQSPLALSAAHPDRMGGLGTLQIGHRSFALVFFAIGAAFSAAIANRIIHDGAHVMDFRMVMAANLVLAVLVYIIPLFAFTPKLVACKWRGLLGYGRLGTVYTQRFDRKWVDTRTPEEEVLGSSDIQSLADLGNASDRIDTMRAMPLDTKSAVIPILAVGAPMVPLLLTAMPLKDLVRLLMSAVL